MICYKFRELRLSFYYFPTALWSYASFNTKNIVLQLNTNPSLMDDLEKRYPFDSPER
jgi:hypothetical protein